MDCGVSKPGGCGKQRKHAGDDDSIRSQVFITLVVEDGKRKKISELNQRKQHRANDARLGQRYLKDEQEIRKLAENRQ